MSADDEDEALTWAGGRDPSHYETPEVKVPKRTKTSEAVPNTGSPQTGDDDEDEDDDAPPATSSVVLVSLGVLGGVYLLYTVGWFISLQRFLYRFTTDLELITFHTEQVLAILAPPLWFAVTLLATRGRKPVVRLIWLLVGAAVLVPWSFLLGL